VNNVENVETTRQMNRQDGQGWTQSRISQTSIRCLLGVLGVLAVHLLVREPYLRGEADQNQPETWKT
jgi:hypothetical protein